MSVALLQDCQSSASASNFNESRVLYII